MGIGLTECVRMDNEYMKNLLKFILVEKANLKQCKLSIKMNHSD